MNSRRLNGPPVKHYHHYTPDLRFLARIDYSVTGTTSSITRSLETIWFAGLPVAQIDYNDLGTLNGGIYTCIPGDALVLRGDE